MTEKVQKGDFIYLEFVGRTYEDNKIFDLNIKKVAEEERLNKNVYDFKPLSVIVGKGFVVKGLDEDLEGKEINKEYEITLDADSAFGKRDSRLIKVFNIKEFIKQKIEPYVGQIINFEDGSYAKVLSVNGGRVRLDFNHPLAGRRIKYTYKITGIEKDPVKKVKIYLERVFGTYPTDIEYKKEKKEIILKVDTAFKDATNMIIKDLKELMKDISFRVVEKDKKKERKSKGKSKNK